MVTAEEYMCAFLLFSITNSPILIKYLLSASTHPDNVTGSISIKVLFVRGGKGQKCVADCWCFFWLHVPAFSAQDAHIEHGMKASKKDSAWNVTKIAARMKFRNAWIE